MAKWTKVTRDKSHLEIQKELRKRGFCVVDCAGMGDDVPDLLVASRQTCAFVELKETLDSAITTAQIKWIASYPYNVMIALSIDDILSAMQFNEFFLRQSQKDKMLQIAIRQEAKSIDANPRITVKRLRKLMYGE